MSRSGLQRLEAIPAAIVARDEFYERVKAADGDAVRLADLMAEGIQMLRDANGLEVVGRDGRVVVCIEKVTAAHCMIAAREKYLVARGSNTLSPNPKPAQPVQGDGIDNG